MIGAPGYDQALLVVDPGRDVVAVRHGAVLRPGFVVRVADQLGRRQPVRLHQEALRRVPGREQMELGVRVAVGRHGPQRRRHVDVRRVEAVARRVLDVVADVPLPPHQDVLAEHADEGSLAPAQRDQPLVRILQVQHDLAAAPEVERARLVDPPVLQLLAAGAVGVQVDAAEESLGELAE